MKKLFLFVVAIAITTSISQAQEVKFGVKGGVNFANMTVDDIGKLKSRSAFHIGGLLEITFSEFLSIQPEVLYSLQGAKHIDKGHIGLNIDIELDYIQVPVMAKFYVTDGFSLEVGPQISFLVSSKSEYEGTISGSGNVEGEDLFDFSSIDISIGLGASYQLPMGVFFTARYNLGKTNLNNGIIYESTFEDIKIYNRVFQLSAGYSF